jgi:hypothetical protein
MTFTAPELQMREAISHWHPNPDGNTQPHITKVTPWVNGLLIEFMPHWTSPLMPLHCLHLLLHLGDHCFNVLDVNAQVLVGDDDVLRIVCPLAHRLSCNLPKAVSAYTKLLMDHMRCHKVPSKLHHLYSMRDGNFTPEQ